MLDDLRFAVRVLRRSPGFAATAIVTLALGIGATTAMFTLVDAVLLRPIDIPAPDRVIALEQQTSYGPATSFLYKNYLAYAQALQGRATMTVEHADAVIVETPGGLTKTDTAF